MRVLLQPTHYVYALACAKSGKLLYIGRSIAPLERLKFHQRKHGRPMVLQSLWPFADLVTACRAESAAIREYRPPLNKVTTSSPGFFGKRMTRASRRKASQSSIARWSDPATREAASALVRGIPKSPEHREKIRQALLGKPHTEKRRKNIAKALRGNGAGIRKSPEHAAKLRAILARGRETLRARNAR